MKRIGILGCALAVSALGVVGCGDDTSGGPASQSDAGPDGGATRGLDASLPSEAGADSTTGADGEAGTGNASDAGDAAVASTPAYALFVGTDFTNAELSVVSLNPDSVAGRLPIPDQDSVPYASGGFGFVLEHTVGQVIVLNHAQPWMAEASIDVNDSPEAGPSASNPRTVLVTTGTKAYVARYASNVVKIVDVAAGTVTGSVDLSSFVAPDDPDSLIDVQDGAYDPATGLAYFLLERINQQDFGTPPDYVAACLASHGQIVAIDATTDAIVDLNGPANGQAIDLLGDDPASLIPDFASGRLIVTDSGCYQPLDGGADAGPAPRVGRGIESVVVGTATATWLYQTSAIDRLNGIVWIDGSHAFVNQGSDWFSWNPTQAALGEVVPNFPEAPFYDGVGRIIGLSTQDPDAGSDAATTWSVVAFDTATSQIATIATNPFESVVPLPMFGVASAFLR
jgi:hypothetical protein